MTRPIFVVGAARSGTTLLQRELLESSELIPFPETHFLSRTLRQRWRIGKLQSPVSRRRLSAVIESIIEETSAPIEMVDVARRAELGDGSYLSWFGAFIDAIQDAHGPQRRLLEKTPDHLLYAGGLVSHPAIDGQVVCIVRDGRDAAASHMEAFDSDYLTYVVRWAHYSRRAQLLRSQLKVDRFVVTRYEDLVRQPELELARIRAALGLQIGGRTGSATSDVRSIVRQNEPHKLLALEPIATSSVGRYRSRLSVDQINLFAVLAGRQAYKWGYRDLDYNLARGVVDVVGGLPNVARYRLQHYASGRQL